MKKLWAGWLLFLIFGLVFVAPVLADGGELVEINAFAGLSAFRRREFTIPNAAQADPVRLKLISSGIYGLRVTENLWDYWSFEHAPAHRGQVRMSPIGPAGPRSAGRAQR